MPENFIYILMDPAHHNLKYGKVSQYYDGNICELPNDYNFHGVCKEE